MNSNKITFILKRCHGNLKDELFQNWEGSEGSIAELGKDQCFIHSDNKGIIVPEFVNPFCLGICSLF